MEQLLAMMMSVKFMIFIHDPARGSESFTFVAAAQPTERIVNLFRQCINQLGTLQAYPGAARVLRLLSTDHPFQIVASEDDLSSPPYIIEEQEARHIPSTETVLVIFNTSDN